MPLASRRDRHCTQFQGVRRTIHSELFSTHGLYHSYRHHERNNSYDMASVVRLAFYAWYEKQEGVFDFQYEFLAY